MASPEVIARPRAWRRAFPVVAALLFLAAHLPFLAPTLEDIDSINFALGVLHFDPSAHRPHPPGYPIFIALGKISTGALDIVRPEGSAAASLAGLAKSPSGPIPRPAENVALGLAFWSALVGALAVFPLYRLFQCLDADGRNDAPAAVLATLACPLFWFTAARPLSDVPGLAAALVAQALFARAFLVQRATASTDARMGAIVPLDGPTLAASGRLIVAGALVSAVAIGFRSQTAWLTLPLLVFVLFDRAGRDAAGALLGSTMAFGIGVVLWAVPLVIASGGPAKYIAALASQSGEDFSGVDMLWTNPTPRRLAFGLLHTFVLPWGTIPLAVAAIALALVGAWVVLRRAGTTAALLLALALPYALFHLVFQETVTTRYALPVVPPVAYLVVRGVNALARRVRSLATCALVVASLIVVVPPTVDYGRDSSPVIRMLQDIRQHGESEARRAVLAMHRRVLTETRRAFLWEFGGTTFWSRATASPVKHEWLELVKYWEGGGNDPVWFLAEPARTDLALIDPLSRRLMTAYRWPFPAGPFVGGVRPGDIDWYEIRVPGWFAGEGWALTPETAGVAELDGKGPDRAPISAWVRRRPGPTVLMIGGRNLGTAGDALARFDVRLDDRTIETADVKPAPGFFLRFLTLPAGALVGSGRYAQITIQVSAAATGAPVHAAIEQFDIQDAGQMMYGFDRGWHEMEYNPSTGRAWRWMAESADVRVAAAERQDLVLRVTGESPLKDFDTAPHVTIRAGTVILGQFQPSAPFSIELPVPAGVLDQAGGLLSLETDLTFVPDQRTNNGDKRRLGLRIYSLSVGPARRVSPR